MDFWGIINLSFPDVHVWFSDILSLAVFWVCFLGCQQLGRKWSSKDVPNPPTYALVKDSILNEYTAWESVCVTVTLLFFSSFYLFFLQKISNITVIMNPCESITQLFSHYFPQKDFK